MLVTKRSRSLLCTKWLKLGRKKKNHSQEIQHASQKYNVLSTEDLAGRFITTVEPRLTTTPFIRPPRYYGHILSNQKQKTLTHFIILKTPLMRPPRYYDQDFMAQRWSY